MQNKLTFDQISNRTSTTIFHDKLKKKQIFLDKEINNVNNLSYPKFIIFSRRTFVNESTIVSCNVAVMRILKVKLNIQSFVITFKSTDFFENIDFQFDFFFFILDYKTTKLTDCNLLSFTYLSDIHNFDCSKLPCLCVSSLLTTHKSHCVKLKCKQIICLTVKITHLVHLTVSSISHHFD